MKKNILKLSFIFILTLFLFALTQTSEANSIQKISMDIFIDNNGNAQITETWNCSANQGTEVYHPYYNLGNSNITNLSVSDGSTTFTTLNSWNTSGSLSSKAYKCGINKIPNGVELCWGISTYGSHTYTVKYNITNFISNLTDSQMIYWTLIPYEFSNSIGNVKIKIYSNYYFQDTIDVWGYGNYGGLAYVNNGAIYMESDGALNTNEYMTILVKLPLRAFNCSNTLNYNFNHYYEMAQLGAKKYMATKRTETLEYVFSIISTYGFFFMIFAISIIGIVKKLKPKQNFNFSTESTFIPKDSNFNNNIFSYGNEGKSISKQVDYYRDIPCNSDLFKAYYISYTYDLMRNKTDLLGAIILKWIKDGLVKIQKNKNNTAFKNRTDTSIVFLSKNLESPDAKEKELYHMLYQASRDGILEKKEFEKWCSGKYTKILHWFDSIILREEKKFIKENLIIKEPKRNLKKNTYTATPILKKEVLHIAGLKRYLLDYTLIEHREPIEVELFESYLIYAQLLGIAKQVSKDFKDLYPEIIEASNFISYEDILFIHDYSYSGIIHAQSAKVAAVQTARDAADHYSSGGGGFSSGGGGGGSFGGGGGRRRFPLKYWRRLIPLI